MEKAEDVAGYDKAKNEISRFIGYKNADTLVQKCDDEIARIKEEERKENEQQENVRKQEVEKAAKKKKRTIGIVVGVVAACAVIAVVMITVVIPNNNYNNAVALMESGDYDAAITAFEDMNGYKDSTEKIEECKYEQAIGLKNAGEYEEAITAFEAMDGYKDSSDQIEECNTAIKDVEYEQALELKNSGDYEAAIEAFEAMDGYKDSADQIKGMMPLYYNEIMSIADVGDHVYFGSYEQDNNTENGTEVIEWRVLAKEDNRILIISNYALDERTFDTGLHSNVTWGTCSLRKWLNGTFLNDAFSEEERALIPSVTISADKNPDYDTSPGNDTTDQVFLLSIIEANQYFSSDEERECKATDYVGGYSSTGGWVDWWLRSPGKESNQVAYVQIGGSIATGGYIIFEDVDSCVRPALWLDLANL